MGKRAGVFSFDKGRKGDGCREDPLKAERKAYESAIKLKYKETHCHRLSLNLRSSRAITSN